MPSSIYQLPEINLSGMKIWLSGAVPERKGPDPDVNAPVESWEGSPLELGILGFVQEFSSLVFKLGGEIIHGCHPSFTPVLLEQARRLRRKDGGLAGLHLAVSEYFQTEENAGDWERWHAVANVEVTEKTGDSESDRDTSLEVLRHRLASHCNAFVAIGGLWWNEVPGRAGIPKEFEIAKSKQVPCFILGGFGGASRTYINEHPDWFNDLNNGLTDTQNQQIAENNNFVLVAGRLISQLALLNRPE